MLGAIIGDIVGSRFEFNPTNDYHFVLFGEGCSFTDDTVCTIAIADALLKGKDFGESLHEWCNRYPHPMGGYGGRFMQWVLSSEPLPYNSFGNGSAMRVSPVAHWFEDKDEMLAAAAATAAPTHNHEEGIKGAQTVALAIFKAMEPWSTIDTIIRRQLCISMRLSTNASVSPAMTSTCPSPACSTSSMRPARAQYR